MLKYFLFLFGFFICSAFSYAEEEQYFVFCNKDKEIDSVQIEELAYKYEIKTGIYLAVITLYGARQSAILFLDNTQKNCKNILIKKIEVPIISNISFTEFEDIKIIEFGFRVHSFNEDEYSLDYYLLNTKDFNLKLLHSENVLTSIVPDSEYCKDCITKYKDIHKYCSLIYSDKSLKLKCQCYKNGVRSNVESVILSKKQIENLRK